MPAAPALVSRVIVVATVTTFRPAGAMPPGTTTTQTCQVGCDGTRNACRTCASNQHICDDRCVSNSDASNCGSTCQRCPESPDGTATCVNGTCDLDCKSGFMKSGSSCVPVCGGVGQPCCKTGEPCRSPEDVVCSRDPNLRDVCVGCGRWTQHCCSGNRCSKEPLIHCEVVGAFPRCERCGRFAGDFCCKEGAPCAAGLRCGSGPDPVCE